MTQLTPSRSCAQARVGIARFTQWIVLAFWGIAAVGPLCLLMSGHLVALPVPDAPVLEEDALATGWTLTHVVAEDCPCSREVIAYLSERGVESGVRERVLLIGGKAGTRRALEEAGFEVRELEAEAFCRTAGSESVPYFQLTDSEGGLWYSGAYRDARYRAGAGFLDVVALRCGGRGERVEAPPLFGCATSRRLRGLLDPLSLKYSRTVEPSNSSSR